MSTEAEKVVPKSAAHWRDPRVWLALGTTLTVTVTLLRVQGRLWWCACGGWSPIWIDTWSSHNSQHLLDPYAFSHVAHGLIFCGALAVTVPRLAMRWRFALAVAIEALWEVVENTEFVINRYREVTASLDYHGDTVGNVMGDIATCALGFLLAQRLGLWRSVAVFVIMEVGLLLWIRDNLTLNVLMLLWPVEAVKQWQIGA
jgi:hypothetical protein